MFTALTLTVDGGCDATSAENQDILPGTAFQKNQTPERTTEIIENPNLGERTGQAEIMPKQLGKTPLVRETNNRWESGQRLPWSVT
jgi:hypothetical protein